MQITYTPRQRPGLEKRLTHAVTTLALILFVALPHPVASQTNEAVLVAFLYNFGKFATWPEDALDAENSEIRYCLWGDGSISRALTVLDNKSIGSRRVLTKQVVETSEIFDCQLIFIKPGMREKFPGVWKRITIHPILTVAMNSNFLKDDGIIELFILNNRLRFRINNRKAQELNLRLDSRLLQLAAEVF